MGIDTATLTSALTLFIVTSTVTYGIFNAVKPEFAMKDKKINILKVVYSSFVISLVFTFFITFVSLQVDAQIEIKRRKIIKS
jgi:TctA family transporter